MATTNKRTTREWLRDLSPATRASAPFMVLAIAAVLGAGLLCAFARWRLADDATMAAVGDSFLSALRDGDVATAMALTTNEFRASMGGQSPAEYLEGMGLVRNIAYAGDRHSFAGRGCLRYAVLSAQDKPVPVLVSFQCGDDGRMRIGGVKPYRRAVRNRHG